MTRAIMRREETRYVTKRTRRAARLIAFSFALLAAACSGGGGGGGGTTAHEPPVTDSATCAQLGGVWQVTETSDARSCGEGISTTTQRFQVSQNACDVRVVDSERQPIRGNHGGPSSSLVGQLPGRRWCHDDHEPVDGHEREEPHRKLDVVLGRERLIRALRRHDLLRRPDRQLRCDDAARGRSSRRAVEYDRPGLLARSLGQRVGVRAGAKRESRLGISVRTLDLPRRLLRRPAEIRGPWAGRCAPSRAGASRAGPRAQSRLPPRTGWRPRLRSVQVNPAIEVIRSIFPLSGMERRQARRPWRRRAPTPPRPPDRGTARLRTRRNTRDPRARGAPRSDSPTTGGRSASRSTVAKTWPGVRA